KQIFKHNPVIVQVDMSEEILQLNTHPELSIHFDINSFIEALHQRMIEKEAFSKNKLNEWNTKVQKIIKKKFEIVQKEVNTDTPLVNPAKIIDVLDKTAEEDSLFVVDAGTQNPYMASNFKTKTAGRTVVFDRGHGNLGYALSASIGAYFAKDDAKVYSMFGDGSFAMSVGELETAKRLNLPIIFMMFQNNSYGWIKKLHQLYYEEQYIGVDFGIIDSTKIAEGFGLKCRKVTSNTDVKEAILWANKQNGPVLLDFI